MTARTTYRYRITFIDGSGQARSEDVNAETIGHVHDGTVSWLNFHDGSGEVLRVRSDSVERIDRIR
ncbi:MAG: hypothetical protein LC685_05920 [Actinobacteria bacterium]|nr:hypothetical protein [Actinomycetota bacterium]